MPVNDYGTEIIYEIVALIGSRRNLSLLTELSCNPGPRSVLTVKFAPAIWSGCSFDKEQQELSQVNLQFHKTNTHTHTLQTHRSPGVTVVQAISTWKERLLLKP